MHHTEASARARIFVEQASSAEIEKLGREFRKKVEAAQNEMSAKGKILSGAMAGEIARITGEMITALVTKRLDLWLESCDRFEVTITDEIEPEILNDVLTLRSTQIQNAAKAGARVGGQQLPGGSGDTYRALLEGHVEINAADVRVKIERHRFPRRVPESSSPARVTHHNEVHIHSSTIGNLNLGSQIGTINTALQQISESDPALVDALKQLTEAVAESKALPDNSKRESIEAIAELLKQAQAKPESRSIITVKALLELLPTLLKAAPDLVTIARNHWPLIKAYFGLRSGS